MTEQLEMHAQSIIWFYRQVSDRKWNFAKKIDLAVLIDLFPGVDFDMASGREGTLWLFRLIN